MRDDGTGQARGDRLHARTTVFAVVAAQIVAGVFLAGMLAAGGDSRAAYSALCGASSGALPNFYLALKMFSISADAPPERLLRAIYVGETLKIALAASMLAAVIAVLDVSVGYVLGGYAGTVAVQWFALLMPAGERTVRARRLAPLRRTSGTREGGAR